MASSSNSSSNKANSTSSSILSAQDTFSTLTQLSNLLNTDLDRDSLALCVRLCEAGANPEALASVVREVKKQSQAVKQQVQKNISAKNGLVSNIF